MSLRDEIIKTLDDMAIILPKVPYTSPFTEQLADAIMGLKIRVDNEVMDWLYNREPMYKTLAELEGK